MLSLAKHWQKHFSSEYQISSIVYFSIKSYWNLLYRIIMVEINFTSVKKSWLCPFKDKVVYLLSLLSIFKSCFLHPTINVRFHVWTPLKTKEVVFTLELYGLCFMSWQSIRRNMENGVRIKYNWLLNESVNII